MKYAVNYHHKFRHIKDVDEIIIQYTSNIMTFVPELIGENKEKRIILDLVTEDKEDIPNIIPFINKLRQDGYNIAVEISNTSDIIEIFRKDKIPYFFNWYANNLEIATIQCEMGVSDIYVTEELGFRIKDLEYLKSKYNVKIRIFPNIAQSRNNTYVNALQRFWVRPEDTEIYEPYVDVFEILSGDDASRLSVIYEIYKNRQWLGNLNDIILDFKAPIINNRGMNPHFAEMRLNCGKKCLLGKCNLCNQMGEMSNSFVEVGLEVIKKKFKPEQSEQEIEEKINKLKERAHEPGTNENSNNITS